MLLLDVVLVKVNIAPSPTVDIPVIALLTKTVPIPSPITVVPAATVEFPPVTVTTSPSAMFESIPLPGCDDDDDDDVEDLRDKIDADVELAFALRNEVVPHAILWFTGEAVDDDDEDFDEVEVSDEEED